MSQTEDQAGSLRRSRQTSFDGHVFVGGDGDADAPKYTMEFDTSAQNEIEEAVPQMVEGVSKSGRTMIFADLSRFTVTGTLDTRNTRQPKATMTFEQGPALAQRQSGGYVSVRSFVHGDRSAPGSVETDLAESPPTREMPAPSLIAAATRSPWWHGPEDDTSEWQAPVPTTRAWVVVAVATVTALVATGGYARFVGWLG